MAHGARVDRWIYFQKMDAKLAMADASYQWIDIDPFGSLLHFLIPQFKVWPEQAC